MPNVSSLSERCKREHSSIQRSLDEEFFEPRYRDARQADQGTLRVAASLGGERFTKADLDTATSRSTGALAQSLIRLIADNLIYRDDHGVYAYTAPMFGAALSRSTSSKKNAGEVLPAGEAEAFHLTSTAPGDGGAVLGENLRRPTVAQQLDVLSGPGVLLAVSWS